MTRSRLTRTGGIVALTALVAALAASPALAEETSCRGTLGAVTVDNLRVPQRASCTLNGTIVKGTVKVGRGATLLAHGIRVVGNVQAENAKNIVVNGSSRVGGSIQVKQGKAASVTATKIKGDLQYDHNRDALRASSNTVGGSIQVVGNSGGAVIANNRVNGNLQCKENAPAPTGGGNIVGGNKENQCARL